jgi:HEAT repeat protein
MRRRIVICAGVVAGVAILLSVPRAVPPIKAKYQGKTLTEWRGDLAAANPAETRNHAEQVLLEIGADQAPLMVEKLRRTDSPLKLKLNEIFAKQKWIKSPFTTDQMRHREVTTMIQALGPGARAVIPALAKLAEDPEYVKNAVGALWFTGRDSIEPLVQLAGHTNDEVRFQAIGGLLMAWPREGTNSLIDQMVRAKMDRAVQMMLAHLHDPALKVRRQAIWSLGGAADSPTVVVPALIGILNDTNDPLRLDAMGCLGYFKTNAGSALPYLLDALHDPNRVVREAATNVVRQIDPYNTRGAGAR